MGVYFFKHITDYNTVMDNVMNENNIEENSSYFKKGNIPWNKGKTNVYSDTHKQKLSKLASLRTGKLNPNYENHKLCGRNNPMYGKTKESAPSYIDGRTLKKYYCVDCNVEISTTAGLYNKKGSRCKSCSKKFLYKNNPERNPGYVHGKCYEPYTKNFNNTLKNIIRNRDNYRCQICDKFQYNETLHVHHIDYNKENCNEDNLISLCATCHGKTNHNREYWCMYCNYILEALK